MSIVDQYTGIITLQYWQFFFYQIGKENATVTMLSKFSLLDLCLKKRMHGSPQIIDRFLHGQTISREQLLLAVAWGLFMPASEKVKNVKFLENKLRWGSSSKCNHMEILRVRTMFTFACRTILTIFNNLAPQPTCKKYTTRAITCICN